MGVLGSSYLPYEVTPAVKFKSLVFTDIILGVRKNFLLLLNLTILVMNFQNMATTQYTSYCVHFKKRDCFGKNGPMKYNVGRTIMLRLRPQKIFIILCILERITFLLSASQDVCRFRTYLIGPFSPPTPPETKIVYTVGLEA